MLGMPVSPGCSSGCYGDAAGICTRTVWVSTFLMRPMLAAAGVLFLSHPSCWMFQVCSGPHVQRPHCNGGCERHPFACVAQALGSAAAMNELPFSFEISRDQYRISQLDLSRCVYRCI